VSSAPYTFVYITGKRTLQRSMVYTEIHFLQKHFFTEIYTAKKYNLHGNTPYSESLLTRKCVKLWAQPMTRAPFCQPALLSHKTGQCLNSIWSINFSPTKEMTQYHNAVTFKLHKKKGAAFSQLQVFCN